MAEPAPKAMQPSAAQENSDNNPRALASHDLEAALQLLVERAQYITGATGAALALSQAAEMVCRASAGACAPPVGARLQVRSGLTGESVSRKQLLRCDNAENDPRVNLETCRELGIASIVVLPLLSEGGEVRGLFELFSDHPYAFEERDLIALERMAELTRTALDLAEKAAIMVPPRAAELQKPEDRAASQSPALAAIAESGLETSLTSPEPELSIAASEEAIPTSDQRPPAFAQPSIEPRLPASPAQPAPLLASPVPESMRRVQRCSSCGFPVSEGRTLCVDCEQKKDRQPPAEELMPAEFVPSFGMSTSAAPAEESWLANHVNLLAILVVILSIVVAIVVFK